MVPPPARSSPRERALLLSCRLRGFRSRQGPVKSHHAQVAAPALERAPGIRGVWYRIVGMALRSQIVSVFATGWLALLLMGGGAEVARGAAAGDSKAGLLPNVRTTRAVGIGRTAAVLLGFVNARGTETTVRFEIGRTRSYGRSFPPGEPEHFYERNEPVGVEEAVDRLRPGTMYHFRLVATSAAGTRFGKDETFRTVPRR
jgi:hypothetical protein